MKTKIKELIKNTIQHLININDKTRVGRYINDQVLSTSMAKIKEVSHGGIKLKFSAPNSLCRWRATTFSTKEPETLEWIDSIPKGSVLWDVGANVGLYSVYAAKKRNCSVWAFEPSIFNLEFLARNIYVNELTAHICIVPMALSDQLGASQMRMTSTEWGGALSTFGQDFGWDGQAIQQVFMFQTIGLTMEDAVNLLEIPSPDYVKMDVDGLEHFILKSGVNVLRNVKEVLIEVNEDFYDQAHECKQLLSEAGLVLKEKKHSEMIENSMSGFQNTFNQIWVRN